MITPLAIRRFLSILLCFGSCEGGVRLWKLSTVVAPTLWLIRNVEGSSLAWNQILQSSPVSYTKFSSNILSATVFRTDSHSPAGNSSGVSSSDVIYPSASGYASNISSGSFIVLSTAQIYNGSQTLSVVDSTAPYGARSGPPQSTMPSTETSRSLAHVPPTSLYNDTIVTKAPSKFKMKVLLTFNESCSNVSLSAQEIKAELNKKVQLSLGVPAARVAVEVKSYDTLRFSVMVDDVSRSQMIELKQDASSWWFDDKGGNVSACYVDSVSDPLITHDTYRPDDTLNKRFDTVTIALTTVFCIIAVILVFIGVFSCVQRKCTSNSGCTYNLHHFTANYGDFKDFKLTKIPRPQSRYLGSDFGSSDNICRVTSQAAENYSDINYFSVGESSLDNSQRVSTGDNDFDIIPIENREGQASGGINNPSYEL